MTPKPQHRRRRTATAAAIAGLVTALAVAVAVAMAVGPRPAEPVADRPLAPLPLAGPLRLVAFGTSLTALNAWPDRLQARLAGCLGRPVPLIRVARPGMGSAWGRSQVDRVVAAEPDLVLIEFAINDADLLDGVPPAVSRAKHAEILGDLAAGLPEAQVMLMTMNPVSGPLRRLQRPRLTAYDAMLRELAIEQGVALADLAPRWQAELAADPGLRPPDGRHPTDAATARIVVPVLAGMIGTAAGGTGC